MDINQNQKAVSPSLRLDLEEDLFWDADRADSRLKALRSSIVKVLAYSENSPLNNLISVGEDRALLSFKPFTAALTNSGMLPIAKGNQYKEESLIGSLYDVNNLNHNNEMNRTKNNISKLIMLSYEFVEQHYPDIYNKDKYFIVSNRGTFAFISLLGSLNKYETEIGNLDISSSPQDRILAIEKYLISLLNGLRELSSEYNAPQNSDNGIR